MKTKPHKSDKSAKEPISMGEQTLEDLTETIINTDATREAISSQLRKLGLGDSESMALVDFLNETAQQMVYGEHPVKMLEPSFLSSKRVPMLKWTSLCGTCLPGVP
ncbi:hypothetical protein GWO43_08680 [candidate division KSB1 bacterium]|nr:hypothetical protein [candidate division KSB1 bacterium]NIR68909.1 hypothetical protein [candidate division KSB1 bacterium]NIS24034.1 hypothetical protein [candidate division KSB1 bacterium]NIT70954.1 hypothetical protein [candidate division KSB1 bacterium]NIU24684.1 hypothetical protein [candidate division KSB1 bacterium]